MYVLILHVANTEPVKVDVDELPKPDDQVIVGKNPRERNDKEITWIDEGVTTVIFPWWRINFVQVLPSEEDEIDIEMPFRD
jgi:hypothetical protein